MEERQRIQFCDDAAAFRLLEAVARQAHQDAMNKWESQYIKMEATAFLAWAQGTSLDKVTVRWPPPKVCRKRKRRQEEEW